MNVRAGSDGPVVDVTAGALHFGVVMMAAWPHEPTGEQAASLLTDLNDLDVAATERAGLS